ncbi:sulfatase family protein [Cyclobacterium plantarum]|uniref:Sulfatase n=1 Tax=Cyclobacterium plantarum TaxID=2716263 RepID=A0ABX0H995_9BACT|nr:sulfatase [Cyclobacterium plantarum]NHE58197.1 sulfatase [Cyclobacterium plantarum]
MKCFMYRKMWCSILICIAFCCNALAQNKKPNIIYIIADQLRASALGYAGDPNANTPNLDQLAQKSFNFKNAVSVMPVCTPYRAALMTGKYPTTTGMFLNDLHLPLSEYGLGDVLADRGYTTAYIGKWHLDGHGRHSFIPPDRRRGFEYWKVAECDHNYNHSHYYTGDSDEKLYWEGYDTYAQTRDAQQYMADQVGKEKPFALFLSFGTPHFPHHTAPEELKQHYPLEDIVLPENVPESMVDGLKIEAQGYYAHCEALDISIGNLLSSLEELGISENTVIVFTSDHGEMMGAHGVRAKAKQVALAEAARVPFLIRYPELNGNAGRTIETPITTPDIFPTLFGMLDLPIPATYEGDDLSEVLTGNKEIKNHAVLYMKLAPWGVGGSYDREYRAIKTSRHTYVRSLDGPWLLFDDINDPLQMNNLAENPSHKKLVGEMDKQLWKLLNKFGDDFKPAQWYIDRWNLKPASHGSIPYSNDGKDQENPQSPRLTNGTS